jgi:hypothetical protein
MAKKDAKKFDELQKIRIFHKEGAAVDTENRAN